jgi:hypothetical protein
MARSKHRKRQQKSHLKALNAVFAEDFDSSQLKGDDRALQALKAHTEMEQLSDHGEEPQLEKTTNPTAQEQTQPSRPQTVRRPLLSYGWQHHVTNLAFCLVFMTLGFLISEIRLIIQTDGWLGSSSATQQSVAGMQEVGHRLRTEGRGRQYNFVVATERLNVRRGPGVDYEVVGQLNQGTALKGLPINSKWVRLDYGRFVFRPALKPANPPPSPRAQTYWIVDPKVPVRSAGDEDSAVVETMSYGQKIQGHIQLDWIKRRDGGYVNRQQVSSTKPFLLSNGPSLAMVKAERAAIRVAPGADERMIGLYFKDKIVRVQAIVNGWARIGEQQFIQAGDLVAVKGKPSLSVSEETRQR